MLGVNCFKYLIYSWFINSSSVNPLCWTGLQCGQSLTKEHSGMRGINPVLVSQGSHTRTRNWWQCTLAHSQTSMFLGSWKKPENMKKTCAETAVMMSIHTAILFEPWVQVGLLRKKKMYFNGFHNHFFLSWALFNKCFSFYLILAHFFCLQYAIKYICN